MDSASRLILKQNEKLIRGLNMSKLQPHLIASKIFTKSMLLDIYDPTSEFDLFSELPTRGPHAFSKFLDVLIKAGYDIEAQKLKNAPKYSETSKEIVFYPMQSKPLGYCFIINNVLFEGNYDERIGSDVDAKELEILFKSMGFDVETEHNLEGKNMKRYLKSFAMDEKLKKVDSCFIIILSHGEKNGVVVGSDTYFLPKEEIHAIFNNKECKNLRGKPKIFLYQACRGKDEDSGVERAHSLSKMESEYNNEDAIGDSTDAVSCNFIASSVKNTSVIEKDPTVSDMLIVHSSLPDHKAYRDWDKGSWFIQDLVNTFKQDHKVHDLSNMLTTVSRKIQKRLSKKGKKKQVIHSEFRGFQASLHLCSNDDYEGHGITSREYLPRRSCD